MTLTRDRQDRSFQQRKQHADVCMAQAACQRARTSLFPETWVSQTPICLRMIMKLIWPVVTSCPDDLLAS